MKHDELLERIDRAAREGWTELDLRNQGLVELPSEIGQLTALKSLNLYNNKLAALPPEISQLTALKFLDLNGNGLTTFPSEISRLTALTSLDLSFNQLMALPPEIGQLTTLRSLNLRGNRLTVLPPEIGQLTTLTFLDLGRNKLTELPPEIGQLSALAFLSVGPKYGSDNWKEERNLPSGYQAGQLTELPLEIAQLTNLQILDLRYNQLPLPPEILERPGDAQAIIRAYLDYHHAGQKHPLNEVKLVLVGEGGVGKTSLVKRLLDQDYDPHESMTEGILVEHWYALLDGETLRFNIWDFGGQEIMHATHQFFLTRRSLYLVVIDTRTEERGLHYWLQLVRSYGGESPIIVVINKDDIRHIELNEVALRAKYPNICAFIPTSCADEAHPGIAQLREAILEQVVHISHIRTLWPGAWFEIKTRLEQMERDYITYDDYAAMCAEADIADTANHTLITFLHDLGVVLNYNDDARLQETTVLKPEWVTQAVYAVINARQIVENTGILEMGGLCDILQDRRRYPHHKHGFILNLMSKFELSFALDEKHARFLIPDLLPKNEILLEGWPPPAENLLFQYRYSVLPGSIITRFIVQMHAHIYHGIVWRTGVCLRYQDNFALIKADEAAECLSIAIIGNFHTRREFLAIIRERLRAIHASFKDLTIAEYVAIPGYPDFYANYNDLLIHEQLGRRTYIPSGLAQEIPIATILDSVIAPEDRGAISGISETLLTDLQKTLAFTGFCDDIISLREQLKDSPVALWIDTLPEATDPHAQAYEIIRHFHSRTTTAGANGLDLFLDWLIPKLSLELQRTTLIALSQQLVVERTAYHTAPAASGATNVTYNITVKEGGQVAAIGNNANLQGGTHFHSQK